MAKKCKDMLFETLKPCTKKVGYEAIPKKQLKINLKEIEEELVHELSDFVLKRSTKILLILENEENKLKLSVFQTGKVMMHGNISKVQAKKILERIEKVFTKND